MYMTWECLEMNWEFHHCLLKSSTMIKFLTFNTNVVGIFFTMSSWGSKLQSHSSILGLLWPFQTHFHKLFTIHNYNLEKLWCYIYTLTSNDTSPWMTICHQLCTYFMSWIEQTHANKSHSHLDVFTRRQQHLHLNKGAGVFFLWLDP